jgi:hypothetical protein
MSACQHAENTAATSGVNVFSIEFDGAIMEMPEVRGYANIA